jgi:NAD(P)-dependent dehydrogenase (short-subunit alcohol dehydrogenase family)
MDTWFEAGHVAIVTGGSRGLGKALARELLLRGVRVIIDGRDNDVLAAAAHDLDQGGEVVAIAGDVVDTEHVHALVEAARSFGRLDLLVNNASTLGETPLPRVDRITHATFRRIIDVNVYAPIHLIQHALPLLRGSGGSTIVNVTSDAAREAYAGWSGYGASKAALELTSRILAAEIEGFGVRVLVADPGDMNTEMHAAALPDADPNELLDPADSAKALVRAIAAMRAPYERVRLSELVPA